MTKILALYLPQFHETPENNEWWGQGFTEWTNVSKAQPRFEEHYQPHLPADLGFYDLRLEEARLAQEALAKEYNIYGFCYYHYWFNGKKVLHEPLDRKLKNPKEDIQARIDHIRNVEKELISTPDDVFRFHSGVPAEVA